MTIVPPVQQYKNSYQYSTPRDVSYDVFLMLVAKINEIDNIYVDGISLPLTSGWTRFYNSDYYGKKVILSSDISHTVWSSTPNARFGAMIYGRADNDCAYAYAAGTCTNNVVCIKVY